MSEENKPGTIKNIIGVIIEPKETFERVIEDPRIFKYLVPITLVQLIVTIVELPKLLSFIILNAQQTQNAAQLANPVVKNFIIGSAIGAALLGPVIMILIATVLIKLITVVSKETGNFKQLFCINTLAYIPIAIGGVVAAIVILFTDPENFKNVTMSLAMFLNSNVSETSIIYKLLSKIDFFSIWSLALSAIGTSVVYKMKIKKASIIVFGIYIAAIAIMVML